MKQTKWTIFHFSAGDFKGVERYLNKQAAKGWELERAGLLLGRWRRTERAGLTWCVDLANPRQEREEQEEYLALCREGGWGLAAISNSMYLFKSLPGRDPAPVQTDRELERRNYNRYYIREIILSLIVVAEFWPFMRCCSGVRPQIGRAHLPRCGIPGRRAGLWPRCGLACPFWGRACCGGCWRSAPR